jgi:hypothetical protein
LDKSEQQITQRTLLATSAEAFGEATLYKESEGKSDREDWGHCEKTSGKLA